MDCPVCQEPVALVAAHEPKILHCGHTVCLGCAVVLERGSGNIACPICRAVTVVPPGNSKSLLRNFALLGVRVSGASAADDGLRCAICDQAASCRCLGCQRSLLCDGCFDGFHLSF